MSSTVHLATYLFTRLRQLDVESVHGVPGDYNLTLLDYVEPTGLHWVGNANELNAGYAADGYARIKGVGAIITTFGVGELSAINAIAGAYAERAAVVHIVGTPMRASQDSRRLIHHTFNDGNYRQFGQMAAHVTIAQTSLRDPRTSPEQIDEVLRQCILHSRPVYIEVPVDLVSVPVSSSRLDNAIRVPDPVPTPAQDTAIDELLQKIYAAKHPAILVDGEIRALGIIEDVQKLVKSTGWPTWLTTYSKGLLDESLPNIHGVYKGTFDDGRSKKFMDDSDLVLCFGPHFSNTNTFLYSSIPTMDVTVLFSDTEIKYGDQIFRDIPAKEAVAQLAGKLDAAKIHRYKEYPDLPRDNLIPFSEVSDIGDQAVTQDKLWRIFGNFVKPGDILMGETGTASWGVREFELPAHARLFAATTWLSIGYMLPAAQGAALAQRELIQASQYHDLKDARTILVIGDGSFQMTAQEMSTIIRENLDVIIFLINNDGYTIERCIHGLKQKYNDIAFWRYLEAPSFFGASKDTYTASVKTWDDLIKTLTDDAMVNGKGLRMVEVFLDREDAPTGPLLSMIQKQQEIERNKTELQNGTK